MIVRAIQKQRGRRDERDMSFGHDRSQEDLFPWRLGRFDVRHVVKPDLLVAVIVVVPNAEVSHDRLHAPVAGEVPHQRAAIRIAHRSEPRAIDFLLLFEIAQHSALDRIPNVVGGLPGIGDELPAQPLRPRRPRDLRIHVPVPQLLRVLREVRPIARLPAVVMSHHSPALFDKRPIGVRHPHPAMHNEQPRSLRRPRLHAVPAVNSHLFTEHIRADVGVAMEDAVLSFLLDDLLFEVAMIGVVLLP